ncbi:hypothetical protein FHX74_000085 [Friedmanniella endophytica]|uniref:Ferritin-like domain-containing protein n=1 Tax=Microlunatus kandeliicorticis TaxID=1759536 RepID=A0A7W3INU0_9ACTN|nr:ferritin-like domain-containing protein [Microlunatus kandeliicorticis]MBA8792491.1 hypothetical protein [Microlunatus kandeliicorticis]
MISRSAENGTDRRNFLRAAGLTGAGVVAGSALLGAGADKAAADGTISDGAILNFALNLEYLEAQFYHYAVYGYGLDASLLTGKDSNGRVTGGAKVPFSSKAVQGIATEIAGDELAHVKFLRSALGDAKTAMPNIDLKNSFTTAARAAGLIGAGQTFDPFKDENSFLLGAFIFEDVGVTAYKGAAPLISNKTYLDAAAGILSVEAYHAGIIRKALLDKGLSSAANAISNARDSLDGKTDDDQGITGSSGAVNLVPADANGLAYSRAPGQVLNVVYLNPGQVSEGGFFPNSINGTLRVSQNNS